MTEIFKAHDFTFYGRMHTRYHHIQLPVESQLSLAIRPRSYKGDRIGHCKEINPSSTMTQNSLGETKEWQRTDTPHRMLKRGRKLRTGDGRAVVRAHDAFCEQEVPKETRHQQVLTK